jgi:hypothetical protein
MSALSPVLETPPASEPPTPSGKRARGGEAPPTPGRVEAAQFGPLLTWFAAHADRREQRLVAAVTQQTGELLKQHAAELKEHAEAREARLVAALAARVEADAERREARLVERLRARVLADLDARDQRTAGGVDAREQRVVEAASAAAAAPTVVETTPAVPLDEEAACYRLRAVKTSEDIWDKGLAFEDLVEAFMQRSLGAASRVEVVRREQHSADILINVGSDGAECHMLVECKNVSDLRHVQAHITTEVSHLGARHHTSSG